MNSTPLESLRVSLGYNKKEFASELGITPNSYARYVSKQRDIPSNISMLIRNKYGISIDWLLTGSGKMKLSESEILLNDIDKIESAFNNSIDPMLLSKISESENMQELISLLDYAPDGFLEKIILKLKEFKEMSKI